MLMGPGQVKRAAHGAAPCAGFTAAAPRGTRGGNPPTPAAAPAEAA
jgi:hypothetical protein